MGDAGTSWGGGVVSIRCDAVVGGPSGIYPPVPLGGFDPMADQSTRRRNAGWGNFDANTRKNAWGFCAMSWVGSLVTPGAAP